MSLAQYQRKFRALYVNTPRGRRSPHKVCMLLASLKQAGIAYVFLGRELGARPEDPATYENGRVQYRKLAATPLFRSGIERV